MQVRLHLFAVVLFSLSAIQVKAQQQLNDSICTQLKLGVKGFQERYHSPGIVVVIMHGNDIILSVNNTRIISF